MRQVSKVEAMKAQRLIQSIARNFDCAAQPHASNVPSTSSLPAPRLHSSPVKARTLLPAAPSSGRDKVKCPALRNQFLPCALQWLGSIVTAAFVFGLSSGTVKADPRPNHGQGSVMRFEVHDVFLTASGVHDNPYVTITAEVEIIEPDGHTRRQSLLFWDGGQTWRFRFAPDKIGLWRWSVTSSDPALNGRSGQFECLESNLRGSIQPVPGWGNHFQYQNGEHMWFLGDTAWSYILDNAEEKLDRSAAERYAVNRASQGFNAIHLMMLSEIGWSNRGGAPWSDISTEVINPGYFQEADERIAFANSKGLVTGLVLGWSDKGHQPFYSWHNFPSGEARERYTRYIAARYSAYNVYFIVAGEWEIEARAQRTSKETVRRQFIDIGEILRASDPQRRMIGIHPIAKTSNGGSSRDFNRDTKWMDFGDYQQNYIRLHENILESRIFGKPVINGEYAYWLRDSNGDGLVDKDHSANLESIRAASWDIVMAGGYLVAGFGSTYLGGARSFTPFLPDDPRNEPWLGQLAHIKSFFSELEYWKLEPRDQLLSCEQNRTADRWSQLKLGDRTSNLRTAPETTYWCLTDLDKTYVVYVRGITKPVNLELAKGGLHSWRVELFDPRSGTRSSMPPPASHSLSYSFHPPDAQDWIVVVHAND